MCIHREFFVYSFCLFCASSFKLFLLCWANKGLTKINRNKSRCFEGLASGGLPLSFVRDNCFDFWQKNGSLSIYYSRVVFFLSILESYSFRMKLSFHSTVVEAMRKLDALFMDHHNKLVCSDFDDIVEKDLLKCFSQEVSSIVGALLDEVNLYVKDDSLPTSFEHKLFIVNFSRF